MRFRGICTENHGNYAENHGISEERIPRPIAGCPILAVVFGRLAVIFEEKWRISETSFRFLSVFIPFLFLFIPFHSSFSNYIITFAPDFIQLIAVMKKIILILAIIFMAIGAKAQSTIQSEDGKYPVYCDLKAYNFWGVGKVKVMLDMGAVSNGGGSFESLYGEDGKQIKFNTVMAAVNYMAKKGWILDKTYYVTEGAGRAVLHYVLVKRVKNDSEIRAGLITKEEQ